MAGQRERAREAVLADIRRAARRQLARDGAAGLSVRAVARELGMVSSAIYRYVDSRDALLTMLIVDAYGDLADAVERGLRSAGDDPSARWRAGCCAVRSWAVARPHDYALLYGSPVPGYAAPPDTIDPATRVYAALAEPLRHAPRRRAVARSPLPRALAADGERIAADLALDVDPRRVVRLLGALAAVFGLVSFEVFGHTHNVVSDDEAFFVDRVDALAGDLGLRSP